jgi:3-hydroxyisobutyrate dehydrogenase-like beta-hydroxyacid dehydrogenase
VTGATPALGFVGLGAMGARMVARLLGAGHDVTVFDTRAEARAALAEQGAHAAESPREVADAAETVLVSLPSPEIVRGVAVGDDGLLGGASMRRYVDLSTSGGPVAEEVAALLGAEGVDCVDAPVSGGPAGAQAGSLTFMVAGSGEAIEAVRPVLERLGSKLFVVGDRAGQGQIAKVINNLMSASSIAITAEAITLGVKAGLDAKTLLDVVGVSSGSNNAALDKFPKQVLTRRFDHGFRLALMAKDVRLCLAEAQRRNVPMMLGSTVDQLWGMAEAQADDGDDCTAIVRMFEDWAGATITGGETSGD